MSKIMIVEDDDSLREIYGIRLTAEGYTVVSAHDGEEALAMAVKERPDLIVSDVMMPKISGFDMLDILRSTPETKNIRVIMMTALSSDDQRERGEGLGADRYLVKSQVGIEDVVNVVHEVLGDRTPAGVIDPAVAMTQPMQAYNTPEMQVPTMPEMVEATQQPTLESVSPVQQPASTAPEESSTNQQTAPTTLEESSANQQPMPMTPETPPTNQQPVPTAPQFAQSGPVTDAGSAQSQTIMQSEPVADGDTGAAAQTQSPTQATTPTPVADSQALTAQ